MHKHINKFGLLGTVLVFAVVGSSTVLAIPSQAGGRAQAATTSDQPADPGSQGNERLAAAKLKACQNREKAIGNIMARVADRGQKQLVLFGTIATRTETFYTNKGKTLSNYDTLVADVNAKQAAAQTAVDAIKSASTGFSCDGSNPRGFVSSFQASLKSEISALQDYRTTVKNLIVGVKSVQSTAASTTNGGGDQ